MSSASHAPAPRAPVMHPATCGARRTRGEGTCRRPAGWGTDHAGAGRCKFHGGASPNGRKAARAEQAHQVLARLGEPAATDPVEALGRCLDLAAGNVAALTARVGELAPELRADGSGIVDHRGPHPLVSLWQAERDRLAHISADALRIGLEGRRVRLAERDGDEIVRVILYVLEHPDLGLTPAELMRGRELAAAEMVADLEEPTGPAPVQPGGEAELEHRVQAEVARRLAAERARAPRPEPAPAPVEPEAVVNPTRSPTAPAVPELAPEPVPPELAALRRRMAGEAPSGGDLATLRW